VTQPDVSLPRGAVVPPRPITAEDFDRAHGQAAKSELLWQVSNRAYGADCPTELQAWGMTTWWTLGRFISALRLRPGRLLLDLACGRCAGECVRTRRTRRVPGRRPDRVRLGRRER
jgi:hypothetical protein